MRDIEREECDPKPYVVQAPRIGSERTGVTSRQGDGEDRRMIPCKMLIVVEGILDGRLVSIPSEDIFTEKERAVLGRLIKLSYAGNLQKSREWLEREKSQLSKRTWTGGMY